MAKTSSPSSSFDLSSADPVGETTQDGFDLSSADPVGATPKTGTAKTQYDPTGSFLQNTLAGVGKLYTDAVLGGKQLINQTIGRYQGPQFDPAALEAEAAEKRKIDAPLEATVGGKVGQVAGALPLAFAPGANTWAGAGLMGAGMGALQPTVGNESRAMNTGVSAGMGLLGKFGGDKLGSWLTSRAAEPFMGWNPATANQAAAQSVGSTAPKLDQSALKETTSRLGDIFNRARDPSTIVPLSTPTSQVLTDADAGLNQSSRASLWRDPQILDLMGHLQNGTANAQQLGTISSRLNTEASSQMTSQGGDRALGRALFGVKEHVDDLVGSSIKDPTLAASYDAARPMYRNLSNITKNSTILNSATGDVNMTALGKLLQRVDKPGYMRGGNQTDLYNAARWGQATGGGKGAPPIDLTKDLGLPWLKYQAMNNRLTGAMGGAVSRLGAPVAPQVPKVLQGLMSGAAPPALSYLGEYDLLK